MSKSVESMFMLVYGTLKQGYGADLGTWSDKNRKIKDVWLEGWDMFKSGYPMCIPGKGKILAELWMVSKSCLPELDSYEGHPNLFKRVEVKVDNEITASMYMYNNPISGWAEPVEGGVF